MLELCFAMTMHLGIGDGWNDLHPCARYVSEDFTIGAYLNSENTVSVYASHTFEYEKWFAEAGLVTGYSSGPVIPMLRAGYNITDNLSVFVSPAYEVNQGDAGVVLGAEYTWRGF